VTVGNPTGTMTKIIFGTGLVVTDLGSNTIRVDDNAFMSGAGAPTSGTGINGAVYLDTTTGRMYGPKTAGAWPSSAFGRLLIPGNTYADVAASYTDYARLLAG
jgi:hypothetical protein